MGTLPWYMVIDYLHRNLRIPAGKEQIITFGINMMPSCSAHQCWFSSIIWLLQSTKKFDSAFCAKSKQLWLPESENVISQEINFSLPMGEMFIISSSNEKEKMKLHYNFLFVNYYYSRMVTNPSSISYSW